MKLSKNSKCLGIGWDVGGWRGNKNAVAMAMWNGTGVDWVAVKRRKLPGVGATFAEFLEHFLGSEAKLRLEQAVDRKVPVVLAIDAPLGLPTAFVDSLKHPADTQFESDFAKGGFIDNPLAFRETDRTVAEIFEKTPLSATFDKLGNPASVARWYVQQWTRTGARPSFKMMVKKGKPPFSLIEVYPALAKEMPQKASAPCTGYRKSIKRAAPKNEDEKDAMLCALIALAYRRGDGRKLPKLCVAGGNKDEGAIWYPTGPRWSLPH